ncbi:MAG TPA: penicillin acylase family protein, partial [Rubricoccaceae bacterium]
FVLTGLTPEPWEPWDALAVERLHAYLATPAPATDSVWAEAARRSPAVARFARADAGFRRGLGFSGTAFARAFAAETPVGTAVVAHQPAGTSALALWVPTALRVGGRAVAVASVPGTLSLPAGTDGTAAWSVFLTSALTLEPFAGAPPLPVYSRVVERDGDETLVAVARDSAGLVLGPAPRPAPRPVPRPSAAAPLGTARTDSVPPVPAPRARPPAQARPSLPVARPPTPVRTDSTGADSASAQPASVPRWRVRWAGFRVGTDAGAFAALAQGRAPSAFTLLAGDGLLASRSGARPLGRPAVVTSGTSSLFIGADRTARWAPVRLDTLAARAERRGVALTADALARDAHSPWAARRLPALLRALGPRDALPAELDEPYAFLRSWDGAYTPEAIGPTLFEAWLVAHRSFTGHLPDPADSLDAALLPYTLRIARAELRDAHGVRPADWRWGPLRGGARTPVLGRLDGSLGRRYAPAPSGPGGHPTALRPGPALVADDAPTGAPRRRPAPTPGPAVWSAWTTLGGEREAGGRLFVRGPGPAGASFRPTEAVPDDPGVTVGIDVRAARAPRRLVLAPSP